MQTWILIDFCRFIKQCQFRQRYGGITDYGTKIQFNICNKAQTKIGPTIADFPQVNTRPRI